MPGINIRIKLYNRAITKEVNIAEVVNRLFEEYLDKLDAEEG